VRDQGKEKEKESFRNAHHHPPRVCLGASSYQSESFLPKDAYPSNACSPVLSLILSTLYFPSSLHHPRPLMLLSPAYVDPVLCRSEADDHRYPTLAAPTQVYREAVPSGADGGVPAVVLPSLPRMQPWAVNPR
jgi:hypothetical protein